MQQDYEFVAAHARNRVSRIDLGGDPTSALLQKLIAGGMTKTVVNELEVIEIDEGNCMARNFRVDTTSQQRLIKAVHQQTAIR